MQLMSFSLLFAFGAAYGLHRVGRSSPSVSFFALRLASLMSLLILWLWQGPELALRTPNMLTAMLVFVPGAAGLAGLVGMEILRFRPAHEASRGAECPLAQLE